MAEVSLVEQPLDECHWTLMMTNFRQWLGAVRQQAFTWGHFDFDVSLNQVTRSQWVKEKRLDIYNRDEACVDAMHGRNKKFNHHKVMCAIYYTVLRHDMDAWFDRLNSSRISQSLYYR